MSIYDPAIEFDTSKEKDMKVIIAGSRHIIDHHYVESKLDEITANVTVTEVVSGMARGVDQIGECWANLHDIKVRQFPARWREEGRGAGYKRNVRMAEYADALIAVWDGESRGTKHMIDTAREHGLDVKIVRADMDYETKSYPEEE